MQKKITAGLLRVSVLFALLFSLVSITPQQASATSTDGTIDSVLKYAWSEKLGWINMGTAEGNIHVSDTALTGYAWNEHTGWIDLHASSTVYVTNNSEGALGGYAWGEGTGYIDFTGVTIDSLGFFHGYASSTLTGRISFNCENESTCGNGNFRTKTDWIKLSVRTANLPGVATAYSSSPGGVGVGVSVAGSSNNTNTTSVLKNKALGKLATTAVCPVYMTKYIKQNSKKNNTVEVTKLQTFLAQYEGFPDLKSTGIYDRDTYNATLQFQKKYTADILGPWSHGTPTGYVYKTTLKKINQLYCLYQVKG